MTTEALARRVLTLLEQKGYTLATAESCTGGWIGKELTAIPGSSAHYLGGVISYTNGVKERLLGVPAETLARFGAVSQSTAAAMAEGARLALCADVAVSATGLAGPGGDGSGQPVGRVYLGCSGPMGTVVRECDFTGDRGEVRQQAVRQALHLLMEYLNR